MADINMSVSIEEQEICINAMRDEKFATIYASDSTYITKLDKLCKESPDMYSLIEDTFSHITKGTRKIVETFR